MGPLAGKYILSRGASDGQEGQCSPQELPEPTISSPKAHINLVSVTRTTLPAKGESRFLSPAQCLKILAPSFFSFFWRQIIPM